MDPDEADTQCAAESIRRKNSEVRNQVPGFLSQELVICLRPNHIICIIGMLEKMIPNIFLAP